MFRNEAFLDIFGFSFAAFACTVAWFVFYVKPHNQALYEENLRKKLMLMKNYDVIIDLMISYLDKIDPSWKKNVNKKKSVDKTVKSIKKTFKIIESQQGDKNE